MPLVTFTSDFGTSDHYVASVKASLLTYDPKLNIVDISHDIAPFNLVHMAFVLRSVFQEFPKGTIHLIGGESESKKVLISEIEGHVFVAPDNGILSLIPENRLGYVYEVVFETADTFSTLHHLVPQVLALLSGKIPDELGPQSTTYKQLTLRQQKATKREIAGHVIRVDHYGNLITNIKKFDFDILSRNRKYTLQFGRERANNIHKGYHEVEPGEVFYTFNASGLLEIGINQGNGAQLLGLNFDSPVHIQFED